MFDMLCHPLLFYHLLSASALLIAALMLAEFTSIVDMVNICTLFVFWMVAFALLWRRGFVQGRTKRPQVVALAVHLAIVVAASLGDGPCEVDTLGSSERAMLCMSWQPLPLLYLERQFQAVKQVLQSLLSSLRHFLWVCRRVRACKSLVVCITLCAVMGCPSTTLLQQSLSLKPLPGCLSEHRSAAVCRAMKFQHDPSPS